MKNIKISNTSHKKLAETGAKLGCGISGAFEAILNQKQPLVSEVEMAAESPAQTERVEDIPTEKQEVETTMEAKDVREIIKAEEAERERNAELVRLQEAVKQKDAALADLDAALKAEKGKPPEVPFEHFKACKEPGCHITKGFNALIENAQKPENLSVEQVKDAMKYHKIVEAPERIVIAGLGGKAK